MARNITSSTKRQEERLRKKIYAVQLYYGKLPHLPEPLTQGEIAQRIGTSTSQVSLLLKEAHQEGLVEVSLHAPRSYQLEGELVHSYERHGLRQARVAVVSQAGGEMAIMDAIGDCAAKYVEENLQPGNKVGVGGGRTMRSLVEHLRATTLPPLEVYPMESLGPVHISANTVAANFAASGEGITAFGLPIPPLTAGSLEEAQGILEYLLNLESVVHVRQGLEQLDVAIIGLGSLTDPGSRERDARYYGVELEVIEAISEKAVGHILWRFFDGDGNVVDSELHRRVISVELAQLTAMSRSPERMVIGIAGGQHKIQMIRAAILGGFIDAIITDIDSAEQLLAMAE